MGLGKLLPAFVTRWLYDRRAHQAFPTAHLDSRRVSLEAELGHMVRIGENVTVQQGVSIGDFSYASTGTAIFSGTIGRFCSIGQYVRIGAFQHPLDHFSTSPWIYGADNLFGLPHSPDEFPKPPVIGSDVWIGAGATILQGVTIGHGAVIGATAVVTRDVEPYSIVAGVPAQLIRKRFDDECITKLLELQWWDWDLERLQALAEAAAAGADFLPHLPDVLPPPD